MSDLDISFGNLSLSYSARGERAERLLEFAFRHQHSERTTDPLHRMELSEEPSGELVVLQDGHPESRNPSDAATVLRLIERATYHFADRCADGPVFHGGCVSHADQATLLVGGSGSGKTCLTTFLLTQGLDYLTDELIFISNPTENPACQGLARPLNLKNSARALFPELTQHPEALVTSFGSLVLPDSALARQPGKVVRHARLARIIFPTYRASSAFGFAPLPKAKAVLLLMQNLINARNLPEHGFRLVSALCQSVPAYTLQYSDFKQIDAMDLTHL